MSDPILRFHFRTLLAGTVGLPFMASIICVLTTIIRYPVSHTPSIHDQAYHYKFIDLLLIMNVTTLGFLVHWVRRVFKMELEIGGGALGLSQKRMGQCSLKRRGEMGSAARQGKSSRSSKSGTTTTLPSGTKWHANRRTRDGT